MTTRQPSITDAINFDDALEFSYSAYHAEAIDYLCLFRSAALTLKAYFFDAGSNDQVIVPHNHRYSFDTRVVAGQLVEHKYGASYAPFGEDLTRWRYDCIVDGGTGFSEESPERLCLRSWRRHCAGSGYFNAAHSDIHTLTKVQPGTILLLTQYADQGPAHTFGWSNTPPACADKYRRMERADVARFAERLDAAMRAGGAT